MLLSPSIVNLASIQGGAIDSRSRSEKTTRLKKKNIKYIEEGREKGVVVGRNLPHRPNLLRRACPMKKKKKKVKKKGRGRSIHGVSDR